ncbi:plant basic secretory protein [Cylindrobasidium torrendii FP15055 ss-10]|uniref:Plant basic secretory protein n=1 Tax=Cylindrobasidium torrendii FP15055 ss-10 TaxID=1314674 RepID=A0A0D7BT20_9AGAR|nr:plant basic secretory protein [Cylindrobasidium torrendii FP15055 ss-10]
MNILAPTLSHQIIPDKDSWPLPTLSLELQSLDHAGVSIFLQCIKPIEDLKDSVITVLQHLYLSPERPEFPSGPDEVKDVKLIVRPMSGVAYTTGVGPKEAGRKEIHLSADYVFNISKDKPPPSHEPENLIRYEILGVVVHELVHCFQYNAKGSCPGGLIEGIADFIRLQAHLGAKHWRRPGPPKPPASFYPFPTPKWDAGYERTAFFLEWIENRYGIGTIRELNANIRDVEWDERIFKDLTGRKVDKLWRIYCEENGVGV